MKNMIIVATATAAVFAAWLLMRKKSAKSILQPASRQNGHSRKHLTDVFSRAKQRIA